MNIFKEKPGITFLCLFSLAGIVLSTQYAVAEMEKQTISRDEMAIIATRGTYMFSSGNIDNPEMIFSPNFVRHEQQYLTPEAKLEDISQLIAHQREFYKVDDIQTESLDTIVENDKVAIRWTAIVNRLQTTDMVDTPDQMRFEGVTISRFEEGKVAEQWVYYDSNLVLTLTRLRYKDYFEIAPTKAE